MRKTLISIVTLFLVVILAACGKGVTDNQDQKKGGATENSSVDKNSVNGQEEETTMYPQLSKEVAANEALVVMNTTLGPIKIKLFPEQAPKTVENFLTHAENGYYDGIIFHRVIEDFMIQGGDPTGTGMGGESIYGKTFEDEFSKELFNLRGALSMANAGPGTNGSQFFIVQAPQSTGGMKAWLPKEIKEAYGEIGGTPHLDQAHTVFGQVIEGMDTVDKIVSVKAKGTKPVEDVKIESIEILQK
ncbi:peptidylprolyl isomerase [Sporosarcina limicola]|uniref:Peptidyl-prolyl cis-trans isomerase n=1 Tax=Sporosarcina limicola TaxID=34101 RepID=A0A927R4M8_9BACL|nr:peptidylprolyl isomerase [Sporosarcina limicola]MBE1556381.1 peptidyl-prolyl cis-trans isomerase B (cyclophilin B) [Sporosarcina limicola]